MSRSILASAALVFILVFGLHFGLIVGEQSHVAAQWVSVSGPSAPAWAQYLQRGDYWYGYSYALAAAFTTFAIGLTIRQRRRAAQGVLGGVTLLGVLYGAGCFLIGCCGSPMLAVYLSLFGASVLGLLKPVVALITTLSVAVSAIVLLRRSRSGSCDLCETRLPIGAKARPTDPR